MRGDGGPRAHERRGRAPRFCRLTPGIARELVARGAASNQLACDPGSQSAKTRRAAASFVSAGTPIPTHRQALPRFSPFVRFRVSTGSHASWSLAALAECDKVELTESMKSAALPAHAIELAGFDEIRESDEYWRIDSASARAPGTRSVREGCCLLYGDGASRAAGWSRCTRSSGSSEHKRPTTVH